MEREQAGAARAGYGEALLRRLSGDLTKRFGRGFSVDRLETARLFYLAYPPLESAPTSSAGLGAISATTSRKSKPKKSATLSRKSTGRSSVVMSAPPFRLSWSHYVILTRRLDGGVPRDFYETEMIAKPEDAVTPDQEIKDPFVLEFLALKDEYSETDLEDALISELETFLLELGGDFAFIGRQRRLRIGSVWYRVDLLFFHRRLRCLVVVDLKLGRFTHADAGQMHLYLNYAREHWTVPGENPPVGLILCRSKEDAVVKYVLEGLSNKVLAAEYRTALPEEGLLAKALEKSRKRLAARSEKPARRR